MQTVAFYSYKGGVGRTLLVANTAQFLAMSGRRVVALDLDLEAPGLHQKLADPDVLSRAAAGALPGAVDVLLAALAPEPRHHNLRDTAVEIGLPTGISGSLFLIPAGSAPSQAYWEALEQLQDALRSGPRNGGLVEAVLELQARIADELAPDFLLIDSRTGITELGGLATSLLADRVVCLTTTAPESVEGTRVVAEALRAAPRLPSQQPLQIDFLVTRVPPGASVSRLKQQLGDEVAVLPHDTAIAQEERVLAGWELGRKDLEDEDDAAGTGLFSATLSWIAEAFPGHKEAAKAARLRMEAVHRAWTDLTQTSERVRGSIRKRNAWPLDQLRQRVLFTIRGETPRQADIVAYDRPAGDADARPLLIIEYVDREDSYTVARRWFAMTQAPVAAVLSPHDPDYPAGRIFSRKEARERARPSDRWDLPLPRDFEVLADPTDVSVDALLDSVRRGHPEYLERLLIEWVRCSATSLHGGASWKPETAKRILDGLARVEDAELARRVLQAASEGSFHRGMWLGDFDDWLDEQVHAELFSPLLWRLPPKAAIEVMKSYGGLFGPPRGAVALQALARDLLGLRYDPDATFRTEGQRILDRSGREPGVDQDRRLYDLIPAFKRTEISFEMSSDLPPLAAHGADVASLVSRLIAKRRLVTTGLLGNYEPAHGKVVLYETAISECAGKLALRARHVGSVTLIHEAIHALIHLGRDLDGRMWTEFSLPPADDPLFEPSRLHEALAQYFTYQQIVRLDDPALLQAFEAMSARQAPAYRAWRRLQGLPLEEVRSWLMSLRRGTGPAAPWSYKLFEASQDDG